MHPVTAEVTQRIVERSRESRADYLERMDPFMTGGGQMILVGVSMSTLTGNWIFGA